MSEDAVQGKSNNETPNKVRTRKVQTEEQYQHQLDLWNTTGPTINTESWLYENLDDLVVGKKIDKQKILHACEKAYYEREYSKCLDLIQKSEEIFEIKLDLITEDSLNVKKPMIGNKKLDNDIIELYKLRRKCGELVKD